MHGGEKQNLFLFFMKAIIKHPAATPITAEKHSTAAKEAISILEPLSPLLPVQL